MGCVLCNMINNPGGKWKFNLEDEDLLEELASDIVQYHPDLVEKINLIQARKKKLAETLSDELM